MNETKTCTKCGETKPATTEFFHKQRRGKFGLRSKCKTCFALYYQEKKATYKLRGDRWRNSNREAMRKHWRAWAARNKTKRNITYAARRKADSAFAVFNAVRDRLSRVLNKYKNPNRRPSTQHIGCSAAELRAHFESNFLPGMSWNNYGRYTLSGKTWTADHIIPLRGRVGGELVFNSSSLEDLAVAASRFNLLPLWGLDNIMKRNKVPHWDNIPAELQAICTPRIEALLKKVQKDT